MRLATGQVSEAHGDSANLHNSVAHVGGAGVFRSLLKADVDSKPAEIGQFLQQCIAVELQRNNHGAEQEVVRYQQGISN